jgi:EAL domain-containing protein (putative c-di-GMP-specific phosphodiesterase class I)
MDSSTYNLDLSFLPVFSLATGEVDHHEVIGRFTGAGALAARAGCDDGSPEVGAALDLALMQAVISLLQGRAYDRLLVPLSWRSCALGMFRSEFSSLLRVDPAVRRRLILEFIAADDVVAIPEAAAYLTSLRREGCRIGLSHFGADSAGYRFLRCLDIDYVKIDPDFVAGAGVSAHDCMLLEELCERCHELECKSVATAIDDARQADLVTKLGVTLAEGLAFGPPQEMLWGSGLPLQATHNIALAGRVPFFLH